MSHQFLSRNIEDENACLDRGHAPSEWSCFNSSVYHLRVISIQIEILT
jgi:hypothetical protein